MRVAYLVSEYPATSHTFIRREVDALRLRGIPVTTFSVRRPKTSTINSVRDRMSLAETYYILPPSLRSIIIAHVTLLRRPTRYFRTLLLALHHRVPGFRALAWSLFYFAEAILLAHELKRRRIDHLHTHFANAGAIVGLLASHYLELPWSLTLHGISETDYPAGVLLGAKIEAAQFVACASYFGRAQAMRVVSPDFWSKIIVVRCALNLNETPKRAGRPTDLRPRIITVGRLSSEKAHLGLLKAFSNVLTSGIDAELVIVGDGPERGRIEQTIDALGLRTNVFLKGRLTEETTLIEMTRADILVLPSFMEGLPVVLMEAMALGLPVIASRVAGIPELVTENEEGLLFCPTDWNDLAEKIVLLIADSKLRDRLGKAGRAKIEMSYEIDHAIEPLVARFSDEHHAVTLCDDPAGPTTHGRS